MPFACLHGVDRHNFTFHYCLVECSLGTCSAYPEVSSRSEGCEVIKQEVEILDRW